jgi:hypothetical protein
MSNTADAGHPFNKPNADLILRSTDRIDFHVYKCILGEASSFFETMFSLPQVNAAKISQGKDSSSSTCTLSTMNQKHQGTEHGFKHEDGHPVLDVSENAKTIDTLLRLCYPCEDPEISDLEQLSEVFSAAIKYEMKGPICVLKQRLATYAPTFPMRVYAIAVSHGLEEEARIAAKASLRYTLKDLNGQDARELSDVPALSYQRLIRYILRCQEEYSSLAVKFDWLPAGTPSEQQDTISDRPSLHWDSQTSPPWISCEHCNSHGNAVYLVSQQNNVTVKQWWISLVQRAQTQLTQRPSGDVIRMASFLTPSFSQMNSNCTKCRLPRGMQTIKAFISYLAAEVDRKTAEVRSFQSEETLRTQ